MVVLFLAVIVPAAQAGEVGKPRIAVNASSDLPGFSYAIAKPTSVALIEDDSALLALVEHVGKDAQSTLDKYNIKDRKTRQELVTVLRNVALLHGDVKAVLASDMLLRSVADKPAEKLMSGTETDAIAMAMTAGQDPQARDAAFRKAYSDAVTPMPWDVVQDSMIGWKGELQTPNMRTLVVGQISANLDPILAKTHSLDAPSARYLVGAATYLRFIAPRNAQMLAVVDAYIAKNKIAKPDIWAARTVTLEGAAKLAPVVVAIWDEGVDISLFKDRLFTNAGETADGRDDDGNGFVDDIHGIGFDEDDNPVTAPLLDFDKKYPGREAELRALMIGNSDNFAGIASSEAAAYRKRLASLKPDEVGPLMEAGNFYASYYTHGTRVAGVAMKDNPAARLMVVRMNWDSYKSKHRAYTPDVARRWAKHVHAIVDYLKVHHVRVVNISWMDTIDDTANSLELNGIGNNAEERKAIALESFRIDVEALTEAFRSASEILFIPAAGNSNSDIGFASAGHADIDLPNVLTVGAVDQAGDAADFTSYGKQVRVYAAGFQIDSIVPGGHHMPFSGTSAAAPQVANLAAKLLALHPQFKPTEVIQLIIDGSTKSADGKRLLIDAKQSIARASKMKSQGGE